MCGRINVSDNEGIRQLLESMGMDTWPMREPRFNVAPTQTLDVVVLNDQPVLTPMSWGVSIQVPGKKGMVTKRVQNARNDKVWQSRLWKPMIQTQRALVPINGFYEWKRADRKLVAAYHITSTDFPAMFLAAIYRKNLATEQRPEVSIVTQAARQPMSEIHDRVPVIFQSNNAAMVWLLDSDQHTLSELMDETVCPSLSFTEVSNYVNKSSNEGPQCIAPLAA